MATKDLDEALGTDEPSNKARKRAIKKPSKGKTMTGKEAKAALRANGDRKTKVKGVDDVKSKTKKKAKPTSNRGVRDGRHTEAIAEATALIKKLKKGTTFTTRECSERWPDGPKGWAFREAAKRMVDDKLVKLKNADRVNTITRL